MAEIAVTDALRAWIAEAYELWWARGADREHGGFHERLNHDGTPTGEARRARLHPRQMFAYSHASGLGWSGSPSVAVEHGLQFFLSHYRREDGLFRPRVSPTGEPLSGDVVLYDQAFALLGLASAYATLGHDELRKLAADLHDRLHEQLAHPSIGFRESFNESVPLSANSHMHLLEASLTWQDLDADERWSRLAQELIELATTRLIDPRTGAVRELFEIDWQPARGAQGLVVEPGHQFEWAWLLLRFRADTDDSRLLSAALRLIEIGETYGIDPARRATIASLNADFSARDVQARLWPQCERIKAACIAFETAGELRYRSIALEAAQTLMSYFDTPMRGLWRDRLDVSGSFIEEPAPASSFYHIVGAVLELTRVVPIAAQ
jgi:mannose/cellobiose epimerase-like protein (N-acyl-D-glucosamine 2-epimerase family)